MKSTATYRYGIALFAALFLIVQSFSFAHANSYGDAPHDHDGVECSLAVLAADQDVILPAPLAIEPLPRRETETPPTPRTEIFYKIPQGRTPPPRGPPTAH